MATPAKKPRFVIDHLAVAMASNPERVVDKLLDDMALPSKVMELREVGHTDEEIHYLLSPELDDEGNPCGGPPLSAIRAIANPVWRRGNKCFGCVKWSGKNHRPSRPFAAQPLGDDGSCSGCVLSHLDVDPDQVESLVRVLSNRGWSSDYISLELGVSEAEVRHIQPPAAEETASILESDLQAINERIEELEARPERAAPLARQIASAKGWAEKLKAKIRSLRVKTRRGRVREWRDE